MRCKTCRWFDCGGGHMCSCPKMHYGYGYRKGESDPDAVWIEDDEDWGMIPGPEFGCVHHESRPIKVYAVAITDLFDNYLQVEIIEAGSIKDAIFQHRLIDEKTDEWVRRMLPDNLNKISTAFFDANMLVDVVEIDN